MQNNENLTEMLLINPQKVDELVKLGLIPLADLPWLRRAILHMQGGMFLPTPERQIFYNFIIKLFTLTLNDPVLFRLLRQRIIMSKYTATEELENSEEFIDEGRKKIISLSGPDVKKAPEGMLDTFANIVKNKTRAGGKPTRADMSLASRARSELRRRRRHMGEEVELNELSNEKMHQAAVARTGRFVKVKFDKNLSPENKKDLMRYHQGKMMKTIKHSVKKELSRDKEERRMLKKEEVAFDVGFAERLKLALNHFNLTSIKDITPETQKEFFNYLENINTATGE